MIKLGIERQEGGWITRFYLRARENQDVAKPVWNEERRTFEFERLPTDHHYWLEDGPSPFQILAISERMEGDDVTQMLQTLCDDLWQMGFRPSSAADRTDALKAKDEHIKDLNEARVAAEGLAEKAIERIPAE